MSNDHRIRSLPFFTVGVAFFVIGVAGQRTFFFVGIAFWVVALMMLRRPRR
jgi:hypothetical protein